MKRAPHIIEFQLINRRDKENRKLPLDKHYTNNLCIKGPLMDAKIMMK